LIERRKYSVIQPRNILKTISQADLDRSHGANITGSSLIPKSEPVGSLSSRSSPAADHRNLPPYEVLLVSSGTMHVRETGFVRIAE